MVQGEADATRVDIAARVDGRVGQRPVDRGENVAAGQLLLRSTIPSSSPNGVRRRPASPSPGRSRNIEVGTRAEVIAQRKAAIEAAEANVTARPADLRPHQAARRLATSPRCRGSTRRRIRSTWRSGEQDQAKLAYEEAVNGATKERGVAQANVVKAEAASPRSRRSRRTRRSSRRSRRRSIISAPIPANTSRPACRCSP